ncbi:MAG: carbamoyl-phosphate synthase large subunit [Ferrimicrobium sp.]|uniref:carbamoyl-phosphate synthase large subunit n=1 Tax=Ferrimicrobium sp. TaxID=2926050 RepID=UPI002625772F|nr:carbamoyl-phosphate synthase large subunit [Ferrimicrobium sp.]
MPRRTTIASVLVIGSGPIVIGQASEFDYSGVQACRVLRQEGLRVILANSNPATIMTDPEFADATYLEPLTLEVMTKIIERERPDALLPTLGGQTALNLAMELDASGVLARYGVTMIGARPEAIGVAESREAFKELLISMGYEHATIKGGIAHSMEDATEIVRTLGFPVMLRPSYILGGAGTGIAHSQTEFLSMMEEGLRASPVNEVLIEESIAGWKEFELEVMRDANDNCVVVCSIENLDPMGVHTGDSITVAPIQTLTDQQYQQMRSLSFAVLRGVGVETGGSNVQFAVDPATGRMVVVEMNPRVSRSSALASKATGFPIAKIATKLALGYTLDEIQNDITVVTPASFEPALDYVVVKIPRWVFEKFEGVPEVLSTSMQSVGEAMAIGRSFAEALQKALRSIERSRDGLNADAGEREVRALSDDELAADLAVASPRRIFLVAEALYRGMSIEFVHAKTRIDPWFLAEIEQIVATRRWLESLAPDLEQLGRQELLAARRAGFGDAQLAYLFGVDLSVIRDRRVRLGLLTTYQSVDTCAGEFEAHTPYFYSSSEEDSEVTGFDAPTVIILGSGPNRIGQGIEFDYCCVHASFALRDLGYRTVMVNSNPETVSTDYDTSSRLYMEPLALEHVLDVIEMERSRSNLVGVFVAFGGQTPLKLARHLDPDLILGTSGTSIDRAEDRNLWSALCDSLGILQPPGATVTSLDEARAAARKVGYPVLIRPSYVLGGRAMEIVSNEQDLVRSFLRLASLSDEGQISQSRPVLIDHFLEDAVEVDVDAVRDATGEVLIGGVMEHVEEAGIHSGDSACVLPPVTLAPDVIERIEAIIKDVANELGVVGLINMQFGVKDEAVYVIEANPRASRTVPFVAKATGIPLAKIAARVMVGETLADLRASGVTTTRRGSHYSVKEAVLPFQRFPMADSILGPEMRSTGEVMGVDDSFELAFAKSQIAAGTVLPDTGMVFLSLANRDKASGLTLARQLVDLGFELAATYGTAGFLRTNGVPIKLLVDKVHEERVGEIGTARDGLVDAVWLLNSRQVSLVINTPEGSGPRVDGRRIRATAQRLRVPCITTISAALAAVGGIGALRATGYGVTPIQEYHR